MIYPLRLFPKIVCSDLEMAQKFEHGFRGVSQSDV